MNTRPVTSVRHPARPRRGVAMLAVLLATAMATILALSFLSSQSTSIRVSANLRNQSQARAVAEAGVAAAVRFIQADPAWRAKGEGAWTAAADLLGGTVSITAADGGGGVDGDGDLTDDDADPVTLTVTGVYQGSTHRSTVVLTPHPGEGDKLILVVPDSAKLSADETLRAADFKGWGWRVTALSASGTTDQFKAALSGAKVVHVCNTVNSLTLGTKVSDTAAGVVDECSGAVANLGIAKVAYPISVRSTYIADNTHYITQPFSRTYVDFYSSKASTPSVHSLRWVYWPAAVVAKNASKWAAIAPLQDLATGAKALGGQSGSAYTATEHYLTNPNLVAIDAGALLKSGKAAAGNRVLLPWGGASKFSYGNLTDDGKTLLQRSLEWAGNRLADSTEPKAVSGLASGLALKGKEYIYLYNGADPSANLTAADLATKSAYKSSNVWKWYNLVWARNQGAPGMVCVNSTKTAAVALGTSAWVYPHLYVGNGGDPSKVISVGKSAKVLGKTGAQSANCVFPTVTLPGGWPATKGAVSLTSGTTKLSANTRYASLALSSTAIIQVTGNVSVLVDGALSLKNSAEIRVDPGSSLTLYAGGDVSLANNGMINASLYMPSMCKILMSGGGDLTLANSAVVFADVTGPTSSLSMANTAQWFGRFWLHDITLNNSAKLYLDTQGKSSSTVVIDDNGDAYDTGGYTYTVTWQESP